MARAMRIQYQLFQGKGKMPSRIPVIHSNIYNLPVIQFHTGHNTVAYLKKFNLQVLQKPVEPSAVKSSSRQEYLIAQVKCLWREMQQAGI